MIGILLVFAMLLPLIAIIGLAVGGGDDPAPTADDVRIDRCVANSGESAETCAAYVFTFEQIAAACSGDAATVDRAIASLTPGELDPAIVAIAAGEPDCEALREPADG